MGWLEHPKTRDALARRLANRIGVDEIIAIVSSEIDANPTLALAEPRSMLAAIYEAAQVGLRPGTTLGQCYLVPFKNWKKSKALRRDVYEVKLILGYRGLIQLAHQGGTLSSVSARIVYERDDFDYEDGFELKLKHRPHRGPDRGDPIAVYATFRRQDGHVSARVMWWWEIQQIAEAAKGRGDSPWQTHIEEMAKKTVVRRELKYLPMAPREARVVNLDEYAEAGVVVPMNSPLEPGEGAPIPQLGEAEPEEGEPIETQAKPKDDPKPAKTEPKPEPEPDDRKVPGVDDVEPEGWGA